MAAQQTRIRRPLTVVGVLASSVALLGACGSITSPAPNGTSGTPSASTPTASLGVIRPGNLVVGHGMLMQTSAAGPVELCVGAVAESYPPQCRGPRVVGDIDWDELTPGRANGVTWTNDTVWAVGELEPEADGLGTFTLDRPPSLTPPSGFHLPTAPPVRFAQLCDDPYAGGARSGGGSPQAQVALTERLEHLDGYVTSWVSDGSSEFNVIVTGSAEDAFADLRRVWKGGLCVEQRDLPTQTELRAAQDALGTAANGLVSTSSGGTDGMLDVQVMLLDASTRARVLDAVSPWLAAEHVRLTSVFQPLS